MEGGQVGPGTSGDSEARDAEVSSSEVARAPQPTLESSPPEDKTITSTTLPSPSSGTDDVFDRRGNNEEMCITVSIGSDSGELDVGESVSPIARDRGGESRTAKGKRPVGRASGRQRREKRGRSLREERDSQREEEREEDRGERHQHKGRSGYGQGREGSSRHCEEREKERERDAHRHGREKHKRRRSDSCSHGHKGTSRSSSHHSHYSKSRHSERWLSWDRYSSSELDEDHRCRRERERRRKRRRRREEERDSKRGDSRERSREMEYGSPEPYCVREKKHRLRMYSDDYPTAAVSSPRESRVSSSAKGTSSRTREERQREKYHSRRRRRHLTPDTSAVELRQELESVNRQIREHKTELLGAMLRSERLRLLHRNLRGEDLPSTEVLQRVHDLGQLTVISETTPTSDVVHELAQLDQAIMDGKRQVLKMMRRMEEQQAASHAPDSESSHHH